MLTTVPALGTLTIPNMSTGGLNLLFVPDDLTLTTAWCVVEEEGRFRVSTYAPGDGIAVGDYTVLISNGAGVMPDGDDRLSKIPNKYRSPLSSPWKVKVTSDPEQNLFNLKVE